MAALVGDDRASDDHVGDDRVSDDHVGDEHDDHSAG
jgi:hypothetical protein